MAKRNGERSVREIEADLNKDAELEGGYAEPREPALLRRAGTLKMSMADQSRIDRENVTLKRANEQLAAERLKLRTAIDEMVALGKAALS